MKTILDDPPRWLRLLWYVNAVMSVVFFVAGWLTLLLPRQQFAAWYGPAGGSAVLFIGYVYGWRHVRRLRSGPPQADEDSAQQC